MILIFSIYAMYKISLADGTLNTLAVLAGVRIGFRERRKSSQKGRNEEREILIPPGQRESLAPLL